MITLDLIECTITMLNVLIKLFETDKIDFDTFESHIDLKVSFLSRYIHLVGPDHIQKRVILVLEECNSILENKTRLSHQR